MNNKELQRVKSTRQIASFWFCSDAIFGHFPAFFEGMEKVLTRLCIRELAHFGAFTRQIDALII